MMLIPREHNKEYEDIIRNVEGLQKLRYLITVVSSSISTYWQRTTI